MSVDPNAPSATFVHALVGELPTADQLQHLDPRWAEPVRAALDATPENRRAALLLAKSGVADVDRLVAVLRGSPAPPDRPWPDPVPLDGPVLPSFPCEILPDWLETQNPALVLPFSEPATARLRDFARAVEPRLAPDGDLGPARRLGQQTRRRCRPGRAVPARQRH